MGLSVPWGRGYVCLLSIPAWFPFYINLISQQPTLCVSLYNVSFTSHFIWQCPLEASRHRTCTQDKQLTTLRRLRTSVDSSREPEPHCSMDALSMETGTHYTSGKPTQTPDHWWRLHILSSHPYIFPCSVLSSELLLPTLRLCWIQSSLWCRDV